MLTQIRLLLMRGFLSSLLIIFSITPTLSLSAAADDCTPPDSGPGVHRPVGADASAYHYDCDSGKWVSAHYTYDPATDEVTPNETPTYTYNPRTGKYDTNTWVYSAAKGDYILVSSSVNTPPAGADVVGGPTIDSIAGTGTDSNDTVAGSGPTDNSISNTGDNSNNTVDNNSGSNTDINNSTGVSVSNLLNSTAQSGNASVLQNTNAGSATSGNVQNAATLVNLLQSSSSLGNGEVATFTYNIDGDVNGDLLFDPSTIGTVQPASGQTGANTNLTVNNSADASINNDVTLNAQSGDANVSENTNAGDATSGNAKNIVNIINLINTAISSGKSFIGTININGNLNGDILLPPDFIDQLIAANVPQVNIILDTGAGSNNTVNDNSTSTTNVTNNNDLGITNNVDADARSGDANVSQNTIAGGATSGNASNSITAFNLTGSQFIGTNALLVFVNVTGSWVGLIVNAPSGATAAGLGGGGSISQTGAGSNNTINDPSSSNTDINNDTKQQITNDLHLTAASGDANVTKNTKAGNARTGDANNTINLMNFQNSSLALSNWFGILFINVYGTWHGSFGINTSAGDPVAMAEASGGSNGPAIRAFGFVPAGGADDSSSQTTYAITPYVGGGSEEMHTPATSITPINLGSTDNKPGGSNTAQGGQINWPLVIGSSVLFSGYLLADRFGESLRRPTLRVAMKFRSFL